jgi:hypothetical protein
LKIKEFGRKWQDLNSLKLVMPLSEKDILKENGKLLATTCVSKCG